MNVQGTKSDLRKLVDAFSEDHMTALQALSLLRLLSATTNIAPLTLNANAMTTAVHRCAHETLMISLWRMFDPHENCGGILGICEFAKKNPGDCGWLFTPEGQDEFPDGAGEVNQKADYWLDWRSKLPFTQSVLVLRHNYVGHRAVKPVLGRAPSITMRWSEISAALEGTGRFVNDFRKLIDNTMVGHINIYEQVINDGSFTLACAEAQHEIVGDHFVRMQEIKDAIQEADAKQIEDNNWVL